MPSFFASHRTVTLPLAAFAGLMICLGAVFSQNLDVPVPWIADGQAAGCASSLVVGLDPNGDNFLAVRSGPGKTYPKLDELHSGDEVRTCAVSGNWVGIYYDAGGGRKNGWVHGSYLADLAG